MIPLNILHKKILKQKFRKINSLRDILHFILYIFDITFEICNCILQITKFFLQATIFFIPIDSSHYSVHKSIKVQLLKNE